MSSKVRLKDSRDVHIGKRHYKQGDFIEEQHLDDLSRAGFELEAFVLPNDAGDSGDAGDSDIASMSYKELKKLAIAKGYAGSNGMNSPAFIEYLRDLENKET